MVKRIFGSLMLVLIATVSILAQIDYNKQIKNGPAVSQGNMNNVRVVDGLKFAQSAAGINAADADLGVGTNGEIWLPSPNVTATDAQISIGAGHALRVFGLLRIDAVGKGPILLGSGASLICSHVSPTNQTSIFQNIGAGTIPSMVRLAVQDGSQNNNSISGCQFNANSLNVTNGVIDASGFTGQGWIRDNSITSFGSGWGIFIQDIQSGALAGTSALRIQNNAISASTTAGCIEILHSATNNVSINHIDIEDTSCIPGSSLASAAVVLQNTSTTSAFLGHISVANLTVLGATNNQSGLNLNGVQSGFVKNVWCNISSTAPCVNVANNTNNQALTFDNIYSFTPVFTDNVNSVTIPANSLAHYELSVGGVSSYLPAVSYLKLQGLLPSAPTGTGCGTTGCTVAMDAGSTNNGGHVIINTGTTPGNTGTITVNFNMSQLAQFAPNPPPPCIFGLTDGFSAWASGASVKMSTFTTSSITAAWSNNGTNLTASQSGAYRVTYWCPAK